MTEDTATTKTEEIPLDYETFFLLFKEVIKDVNKRKQLAAIISDERPKRWKKNTVAPYYKELYGMQMKAVFDAMILDRKDREFKYQEFPTLSRNTLYLRVNQSRLYLLEELDPDGVYKRFSECISITREKTGIRLSIPEDFKNPDKPFVPDIAESEEEANKWEDELTDFLENGKPGEVFLRKNLAISDEKQQEINDSMAALSNVICSITYRTIKVVKLQQPL